MRCSSSLMILRRAREAVVFSCSARAIDRFSLNMSLSDLAVKERAMYFFRDWCNWKRASSKSIEYMCWISSFLAKRRRVVDETRRPYFFLRSNNQNRRGVFTSLYLEEKGMAPSRNLRQCFSAVTMALPTWSSIVSRCRCRTSGGVVGGSDCKAVIFLFKLLCVKCFITALLNRFTILMSNSFSRRRFGCMIVNISLPRNEVS